MAKVFISLNSNSDEIEENIYFHLSEEHESFHLQPEIGNEWQTTFRNIAQEVDVFIVFISERVLNSTWDKQKLDTIISYSLNADKALIPIVIGKISLPKEIANRRYIFFDPNNGIGEIDRVVGSVNQAISA